LTEVIEVTNLSELKRTQLLRDCYDVFALEENDRGETSLIEIEVDTGDVASIKKNAICS